MRAGGSAIRPSTGRRRPLPGGRAMGGPAMAWPRSPHGVCAQRYAAAPNVTVYVSGIHQVPVTDGPSCDHCATSLPGGAIARTTTDAEGSFPPRRRSARHRRSRRHRGQALTGSRVCRRARTPRIPDGTFRLPKNRSEGDGDRGRHRRLRNPVACVLDQAGYRGKRVRREMPGMRSTSRSTPAPAACRRDCRRQRYGATSPS